MLKQVVGRHICGLAVLIFILERSRGEAVTSHAYFLEALLTHEGGGTESLGKGGCHITWCNFRWKHFSSCGPFQWTELGSCRIWGHQTCEFDWEPVSASPCALIRLSTQVPRQQLQRTELAPNTDGAGRSVKFRLEGFCTFKGNFSPTWVFLLL